MSGERVFAVQWHPEWRLAENPHSVKLFFLVWSRATRRLVWGSRRSRRAL